MRLAQPRYSSTSARTGELDAVRVDKRRASVVGAAATQGSVEWRSTLADEVPLLAMALPWHLALSDPQPRHGVRLGRACRPERGVAARACRARRRRDAALARRARRALAAQDFFHGMMMTAREPDETRRSGALPADASPASGYALRGIRPRGTATSRSSPAPPSSTTSRIRIAVGGVADRPVARAMAASAGRRPARRTERFELETERAGRCARSARNIAANLVRATRMARDRGGEVSKMSDTIMRHGKAQRIALTLNGRERSGYCEPRELLSRLPAPRTRRDRHACRLRARRVRRLHRAGRRRRRRASCLMLAVQAEGGDIRTVEGLAPRSDAWRPAAGVPAASRAAMRLLHGGHSDVVRGLSAGACRIRPKSKCARCSPAISAAVPATRRSWLRCSTWRRAAGPRQAKEVEHA